MNRTILSVMLTVFSLVATEKSVQADAEARSWDEIHSGKITMSTVGVVDYEISYSSVGYDHFEASVSISWEDEGMRSQTLFDGIHDQAPAKVSTVGPQLCISVRYCRRYQEDCPVWSTLYSYDHERKSFVGSAEEQQSCPEAPKGMPEGS